MVLMQPYPLPATLNETQFRINASDCGCKEVSLYILRCRRPQSRKHIYVFYLLPGAVLVARLSQRGKETPAGIASWRTRRMARRKRDVSDLPYAAPPLSCAAFFVKVQKALMCRTYGKGNIGSGFTSKLEVQDSPYQP